MQGGLEITVKFPVSLKWKAGQGTEITSINRFTQRTQMLKVKWRTWTTLCRKLMLMLIENYMYRV